MIHYVVGDATAPHVGDSPKIIAHVCNDIGAWGAGFVVPLGVRFPEARRAYLSEPDRQLGSVQIVEVNSGTLVANMIAQRGIGRGAGGSIPLRYDALEKALTRVASVACTIRASVHMPRIGCGLAGGSWPQVAEIIERQLEGIQVYVYDLKK